MRIKMMPLQPTRKGWFEDQDNNPADPEQADRGEMYESEE
jgi:hypothetical protein